MLEKFERKKVPYRIGKQKINVDSYKTNNQACMKEGHDERKE